MNKIKVLEVIRQGQIGGGESHLLDLVTFLDKEQFEPVCLAFTSGEMFNRPEAMGIRCFVIDTLKAFDLKIQQDAVMDTIRNQRVPVICINDGEMEDNEFEIIRSELVKAFDAILPKKSEYEKT